MNVTQIQRSPIKIKIRVQNSISLCKVTQTAIHLMMMMMRKSNGINHR